MTHKATKRALTQMTESLQDELREAGIASIGVHNLSPGGWRMEGPGCFHLKAAAGLNGCGNPAVPLLPFIAPPSFPPALAGMLLTDLLLRDSTPAARRFFNALAEEPETVATALVPRVRGVQGTGTSIEYLTPPEALRRILAGLPQIIRGGRFFDERGERVRQPGQRYLPNGVRVQVGRPPDGSSAA